MKEATNRGGPLRNSASSPLTSPRSTNVDVVMCALLRRGSRRSHGCAANRTPSGPISPGYGALNL